MPHPAVAAATLTRVAATTAHFVTAATLTRVATATAHVVTARLNHTAVSRRAVHISPRATVVVVTTHCRRRAATPHRVVAAATLTRVSG